MNFPTPSDRKTQPTRMRIRITAAGAFVAAKVLRRFMFSSVLGSAAVEQSDEAGKSNRHVPCCCPYYHCHTYGRRFPPLGPRLGWAASGRRIRGGAFLDGPLSWRAPRAIVPIVSGTPVVVFPRPALLR